MQASSPSLFFRHVGYGGLKTNLNNFFLYISSVWITFFLNGRLRQEEGMIQAN